MLIYKSFKFELIFNDKQTTLAYQTAGSCRYIWNERLSVKINKRENNKERITRFESDKKLTELKKVKERLCLAPSQALQQVNKDLDQSFKNFFQ